VNYQLAVHQDFPAWCTPKTAVRQAKKEKNLGTLSMVQMVLVLVEKLALFQQFICRGALQHDNKLFYEKSFIQKHTIEP
jgi:hypothetical protein